jgi:Domain of unknown function DUF29
MTTPDYDTDFYAWTQAQAAAIRAKDWATVDLEHVAEEIESLGNEQRHAVLWHLLKWASQPDHRTTSWRTSILNARVEIADRLEDYPSLRPHVPALLASAYPRARRLASAETNLPLATFPETCPWTMAQVLDEDFWPEDEA